MTDKVDIFGNPIDIGDVIAYTGPNVGLIVGVVIKFNPASYKIKYKQKTWQGNIEDRYHNVLFDAKYSIITIKSMVDFKPEDVLDEVEKLRLGFGQ